jgi:hypothetical protein
MLGATRLPLSGELIAGVRKLYRLEYTKPTQAVATEIG